MKPRSTSSHTEATVCTVPRWQVLEESANSHSFGFAGVDDGSVITGPDLNPDNGNDNDGGICVSSWKMSPVVFPLYGLCSSQPAPEPPPIVNDVAALAINNNNNNHMNLPVIPPPTGYKNHAEIETAGSVGVSLSPVGWRAAVSSPASPEDVYMLEKALVDAGGDDNQEIRTRSRSGTSPWLQSHLHEQMQQTSAPPQQRRQQDEKITITTAAAASTTNNTFFSHHLGQLESLPGGSSSHLVSQPHDICGWWAPFPDSPTWSERKKSNTNSNNNRGRKRRRTEIELTVLQALQFRYPVGNESIATKKPLPEGYTWQDEWEDDNEFEVKEKCKAIIERICREK